MEDQPELESSTAVQAPPPAPPPHRIFVSYTWGRGKRVRFDQRIMQTTFPDIETETHLQSILGFLQKEIGEDGVTLLFWQSLDS